MSKPKEPRTDEVTAHQLWVDILINNLRTILNNRKRFDQAAQHRRANSRELAQFNASMNHWNSEAIQHVVDFENFRLQAVADAMSAQHLPAKQELDKITADLAALTWYKFKRRRDLQRSRDIAAAIEETFRTAFLVLVNTPPPAAAPAQQQAPGKVVSSHITGDGLVNVVERVDTIETPAPTMEVNRELASQMIDKSAETPQ